jgi:tetratricopeptide (TPR) repeat protein
MTLKSLRENGAPTSGPGCPDAELLAAYIDGRATLAEQREIEAHLARCEDCYFVFSETVREQQAQGGEPAKKSEVPPWWRVWSPQLAAGFAAAVVVVIGAQLIIFKRPATQSPEVDLKIALEQLDEAAGPYRKFEPRLTVTPTYRPLEPATRSAAPSAEAPLALREAALRVERAATARAAGTEGRRALGAMYFTLGGAGRAADALAPLAQSTDVGVLNDLAATLLARQREGDVKSALGLLERAVTLDPKRAEAWFNLGLAAEAAGQAGRAIEAWQRAVALDPTSGWAEEAQARLKRLKDQGRVR